MWFGQNSGSISARFAQDNELFNNLHVQLLFHLLIIQIDELFLTGGKKHPREPCGDIFSFHAVCY